LAMVVARFKEIENFKPQPYWELQTLYRETLFSYEEGRFLKKESGELLAQKVQESDFEVTAVEKKNGNEFAPKLFDLTGLQVYCNNKFGFSAEETLKIAQTLYEQKVITYPRVDTTFLPNDVYPKVAGILQKLTAYANLTQPLLGKKIKKSPKVFNDKKVTDHHAIIPTGIQQHLQYNQQRVYDIVTKRFIAVFYEDCLVANTTVFGKAADVPFKATGKEILKKGFRVVFEDPNAGEKEVDILPSFKVGEKGPHQPSFLEKETKAPNYFTEASLLRAMETAGKQIDDEDLRDLMKENGIGRPSTRANIIETLFKRQYIVRNKKQLLPTPTGVQLIDTIQNELLKSAELTGSWEKQLKDIEKGTFTASAFIRNMKQMVEHLVSEVRLEVKGANISHAENVPKKVVTTENKKKASGLSAESCPKCKNGTLLKGRSAYGCSQYKTGCDFKLPFTFAEKKISENQFIRLLQKGSTVNLKEFKTENGVVEGLLRFDGNFRLKLEPKKTVSKPSSDQLTCPKCQKGNVLKGKTAYGCSGYKSGCDFKVPFDAVRKLLGNRKVSKDLVYSILKNAGK
jgi:DNA topoisomerase-3